MANRGAIIFAGLLIGGVAAFAGDSFFPSIGSPQPADAAEQPFVPPAAPQSGPAPRSAERGDGLTHFYPAAASRGGAGAVGEWSARTGQYFAPAVASRGSAGSAAAMQSTVYLTTARQGSAVPPARRTRAGVPDFALESAGAGSDGGAGAFNGSAPSMSLPMLPPATPIRIERLIVGGELLAAGLVSESVVREQERRSRYLVCFQLSAAGGINRGDFRLEDSGGVISEPLGDALRGAGNDARTHAAGRAGSTLLVVFPVYNDSSPARLLHRAPGGQYVPVSN